MDTPPPAISAGSPLAATPPHHHDSFVTVSEADLDLNRHVNNVIYLRWVQDAAVGHWKETVPPEIAAKHAWVVIRHEIDYKKPAHLGDVLRVRTWVRSMSALISERRCRIFREADGILLADVCTQWCVVNPETERPRRMDPRIPALFGIEPTR
ncbi:MAG: acyl-CoA thioesterase [Puniceicoccales bacterium]|jgi:acyl-CoA thioester hydrolase|nr:acyl-CoA thioesterase [Puniceicoccales bacterium]